MLFQFLKLCSKFTGRHPWRSAISITLRHGFSPVNLLHIFRATSKTWTQTLDPDSEKHGTKRTWTQKNMDPGKPGRRKTWTLKNLDSEKPGL